MHLIYQVVFLEEDIQQLKALFYQERGTNCFTYNNGLEGKWLMFHDMMANMLKYLFAFHANFLFHIKILSANFSFCKYGQCSCMLLTFKVCSYIFVWKDEMVTFKNLNTTFYLHHGT